MFGNALLPLLASVAAAIASVSARFPSKAELHAKQAEAAARIRANMPRATSSGVKNITFSDPRASRTSPSPSRRVFCFRSRRSARTRVA